MKTNNQFTRVQQPIFIVQRLIITFIFLFWFSTVQALDSRKPFLQTLEPYKPIYVLTTFFLNNAGEDQGYQNQELHIQYSFKKHLFRSLYFAYSHKSFWQLYDKKNSRSFRENNYNPEIFLEFNDIWKIAYLRIGLLEHESNGEKQRFEENAIPVNNSRTWNRFYLYGQQPLFDLFKLGIKLWLVTDREDSDFGSFYDDNRDIQQYMGNGEIYLNRHFSALSISIMLRRGWKNKTETIRLESRLPLHQLIGTEDTGIDIYFQAFSGYGDSLIDYNRKVDRFSIGFSAR